MTLERITEIAKAVQEAGGRALLVGGSVRDRALGRASKDYDVEVFGLSVADLERVLENFGQVLAVGRSFGVFRMKGLDVDFSLPRVDSKRGTGHRGFDVEVRPDLTFAEAARRRDLTINAMAEDPLTGELLDPLGGLDDLRAGVLRAADTNHFAEDPLRGLRVAQFAARLEMQPDAELKRLCSGLDLSELSGERIREEFVKLLTQGSTPSVGLGFLEETGLIRFFPPLEAIMGVPQDPEWHPEGDVWLHTLMVVDEAAKLRRGDDEDWVLMLGALCHDLGKPLTTHEEKGRIRSPGHDVAGVEPTQTLLQSWRVGNRVQVAVQALVRYHLAPALLCKNGASAKAYRRLLRKLLHADVSWELLLRVATADHLGRTTDEAKARRFPAGEVFKENMLAATAENPESQDVVKGRHLIARGLQPGAEFGKILARCRDIQDDTGSTRVDEILDRALDELLG